MTTTLATDTFASRTVSGSFGTGSDGQVWQAPFNNVHAVVAVGSNEGSVYYDNISGGIGRYETIYGTLAARDANITCRFQFGSIAGSADFRLYLRYIDANNWSQIRVTPTTIFYRRSIGGTITTVTAISSLSFAAATFYRLRFVFNQSSYSITWWLDGNSEPAAQFTSTDTNVPWAGYFGVGIVATGITLGTATLVDSFVMQLANTAVNPVYYVDGVSGSDSNDGSQAHPWQTLQYAMYSAILGATINVLPATYMQPSNTPLTNLVSGSATQRLQFVSTTKWGAKIVGTGMFGLNTNAYVVWNQGDYVDYIGFDVTGDGRIGINNANSSCSVKNCRIHDIPAHANTSGGGGIDHSTPTATGNNTSTGNLIFNIGEGTDNGVHGIYQSNPGGIIQNNICLSNSGMGINLDHNPSNCIVENNLAGSNKNGGIWIGGISFTADFNYVANNIIMNNTGPFGALYESSGVGTNNQYRNNLIWNNANTFNGTQVAIQGVEISSGQYTGTIFADPRLANYQPAGSGDYHLLPASPCINAGISTNAPSTDYDGAARPFGTAFDIGPYEFQGGIFYSYGDFQINDHLGGLGYFLMSKDLDFPEMKPAISPLALYDGNKITGYQVAHRQIQCDIYIVGTSRTDCIARKDQLEAALALRDQQLVLHEDGRYWIANAISGKARFAAGKGIVQAQIPVLFICANPYAIAAAAAAPYDSGNVAYTTVVVAGSYRSPVFYVAGGGTIYCWPTITLTHQLATPGSTTLNGALTQGTNYTSITVTSAPALSAGQVIKLSWTTGGNTFAQKLVVSGTVTAGATSIPVNSFTASASFPITSTTVAISTAWNNVTIAQLTDNYSIQANGNNDQTYEIVGGNSVVSGVYLLPQAQNDFITINCDPTASNGWTITGSVQGVSFTYQPNGAFPPLEPTTTQWQITVTADNQPTADFKLAWTPRYAS
jgi:hypothetical protein